MRLNSIAKHIKNFISAVNAKKIIHALIISLLVIAPSLCAFGYTFYHDYFKKPNYFSVTLYDAENNIVAFDEVQPEFEQSDSLAMLFYDITISPTEITRPTESAPYVRAVTEWNGKVTDIKCYFSENDTDRFYVDTNGKAFKISADQNRRFMNTNYSEKFCSNSKIYSLKTIDHDIIIPKSISWTYKSPNDMYTESKNNITTAEKLTYEITGSIDIDFEKTPDSARAYVYDGEELIYDGTVEQLPSLTAASGNLLHVLINAEWNKTPNTDKYGSASYDFYVKIKNSSTFSVNSETVRGGEFIILTCTNITNVSKISFEANSAPYKPFFATDNDVVKAIIPFSTNDPERTYSFTVTYGASTETFSIKVIPSDTSKKYSCNTLFFDNITFPEKNNRSIKDELLSYNLPTFDTVYFHGNFEAVNTDTFYTLYSHNSTMQWGESLEYSYTTVGTEYIVKENHVRGASVKALQNGIVVKTGRNNILGNFVVIDHGCGLRTWYTQLSSIDVIEGDILLLGQGLGKAGNSILDGKEGFKLYCTVNDTIIDPEILFNIK